MILHCRCGAELEVDESLPPDVATRDAVAAARLDEAEAWSKAHRTPPEHGLYFNVGGIATGGTPPSSP